MSSATLPAAPPAIRPADVRLASLVYIWLLFSPLITVPAAILGSFRSYTEQYGAVVLSPDGRRIAYSTQGLWVINTDGTGRRQLATSKEDICPAWSPDSRQIAFVADDTLQVIDLDSQAIRRLETADSHSCPSWSSRGVIAFADKGVRAMRPGDSASVLITDGAHPVWTPDGTHVLFTRKTFAGETRWKVGADGSNPSLIGQGGLAVYSPDGRQAAYWSDQGSDIQVINLDGTNLRTLHGSGKPAFSPDGSRIAFRSPRIEQPSEIAVAEGDVITGLHRTVPSSDPVWRADGQAILYFGSVGVGGSPLPFGAPTGLCVAYLDGAVESYGPGGTMGVSLRLLAPALFHLVLLVGLFSSSLFVVRHSQQALILASMGTIASWNALLNPEGSSVKWLVSLVFWLGTTLWGFYQVSSGDCLLMRILRESDRLPRNRPPSAA